jgi:hypothetical protein
MAIAFSISASAFTYTVYTAYNYWASSVFLNKVKFSTTTGTIKSTFCVGFLEKLAFLFGHNSDIQQE